MDKQDTLKESLPGLNESPKNPKANTLIKEKLLSFTTPSNLYRIREEIYQENGENVKRTILLSHEK